MSDEDIHPLDTYIKLMQMEQVELDKAPYREVSLASIAISMKRIADALTNPANKYGESVIEAIATALREEK